MNEFQIIIFSDNSDISTNRVLSYLFNSKLNIKIILPEFKETKTVYEFIKLIKKADSIWLRRGMIPTNLYRNYSSNYEIKAIYEYLHSIIENQNNTIGSLLSDYNQNKLIDVNLALSIGLHVPETYIVSTKNELLTLFSENKNDQFITKASGKPFKLKTGNNLLFYGKTTIIGIEIINRHVPDLFHPTQVQKYIQKKFEIRVFYLLGKCYAMAIFSQSSEQTKLDFRNYDLINSNRMIPFSLPEEISIKINILMNKKNLNCGSLDLIYGIDNKYYFLEINPVGHFGWLSYNCNYNLEKKIALTLLNK